MARLIPFRQPVPAPREARPAVAPAGRLIELSGAGLGHGATTVAVSFVARCQARGELAAWVQPEGGPLYPPDLAAAGIDLDALVVVHVPKGALARAAELLLRSAAFGLVVVDASLGLPAGAAWQSRLSGVARKSGSAVVLLTGAAADAPSAGPLVAVRLAPSLARAGERFEVRSRVLRDKVQLGFEPCDGPFSAPAGAR